MSNLNNVVNSIKTISGVNDCGEWEFHYVLGTENLEILIEPPTLEITIISYPNGVYSEQRFTVEELESALEYIKTNF